MSQKKKLLVLIDWFVPGYKAGGPIQSCVNLCSALSGQYDIFVLTTDTDHGELQPYAGVKTNVWTRNESLGVQVCYLEKSGFSLSLLQQEIVQLNPDFVYLNHLFSPRFVVYPLWLTLTGKIKSTVIVCPRGALYDSALNVKRYKKVPLLLLYKWAGIQKKIKFHATNGREAAAVEKFFPGAHITVADNLPNLQQPAFVSCKKEAGSLSIVYIARIVPIKNLYFLLQVLKEVKANARLSIVGPIEDETYWASCRQLMTALPRNVQVQYEGAIENRLLNDTIRRHHLYALPTLGENFGHSIFEALLAGRPVLISDQTPWLGLQAQQAGWDLPLKDPDDFVSAIETMAALQQEAFDQHAKNAWNFAAHFIQHSVNIQPYLTLFS